VLGRLLRPAQQLQNAGAAATAPTRQRICYLTPKLLDTQQAKKVAQYWEKQTTKGVAPQK